ncbi:prolyl aminopeptidase [Thalassotalea litorea]|uniref:Proline iminopeptidase n=1 Tax=Thalassotalea litorea TaxID=2020715 RepID=A0A5R9IPC2_9GAMM|nr:prolyl aminopeptidase [Thalassotalea litorea]TLU67395.1 prolyl aminopeptidase [Thalassotalea litorea]
MRPLHPNITPYDQQMLDVGDHQIYVEQSGNPQGIPVLYLHGGPGAGSSADHRRYFDPEKYRIIIFDQRGCGRSTPHASIHNNTTWDLIEDIEEIRQLLAINQWLVAGGSWGTTLAIAYGIKHVENVLGFILRGIFLGTPAEVQWLYSHQGAAAIFPDYYQDFLIPLQPHIQQEPVKAYQQLLDSDNELVKFQAAKAWSLWEQRISTLHASLHVIETPEQVHSAVAMAHIENHYFNHHCFLEADYLLNHIDTISHIPAVIIHGRYDMVCQLQRAHQLQQRWQNATLNIIPDAGHSGFEVGIINAFCQASDKMAAFIEEQTNR